MTRLPPAGVEALVDLRQALDRLPHQVGQPRPGDGRDRQPPAGPARVSRRSRTSSLPVSSDFDTATTSGLSAHRQTVQHQLPWRDGAIVCPAGSLPSEGNGLDQMDEDARPLDVPQKTRAPARRPSLAPPRSAPAGSATTNAPSPPIITRPRLGCLVVKRIVGDPPARPVTAGSAAWTCPALGKPTSPTSGDDLQLQA